MKNYNIDQRLVQRFEALYLSFKYGLWKAHNISTTGFLYPYLDREEKLSPRLCISKSFKKARPNSVYGGMYIEHKSYF